jgi:D-alanyl-D-alanine carboxypeptidase (penicillin-binding protein 5/6)
MLLVMLNAKTDRWNIAANMFDTAFLGNRPDPAWIVQTRGDSGRAGVSAIKQQERLEPVSSGKSGKSVYRLSKAARRSKNHPVVLSKSGRRSHQQALALSKPSRHSKREALLLSRSNHKSKRGTLAVSNAGRKSKKHDIASSKQVRRNKKKVTLS